MPVLNSQIALSIGRSSVFNCFIWDICSVIWRQTSLPSVDTNRPDEARTMSILFTDLQPETLAFLNTKARSVTKALSITHSAAFAGFVADFLEQHTEVDCRDNIKGRVKVKYLDYLKQRGLTGLWRFLTTRVAALVDLEQKCKKT